MEPATKRYSDSKLNVTLLDTPEHVQAEICEDKRGQKPNICLLQLNEELIQERN